MSVFEGRVVTLSGSALPNLQVVAYDIDPGHKPEEVFSKEGSLDFWNKIPGQRIGSRVTDRDGRFHFAYDPDAFRPSGIENRTKSGDTPDIWFLILAPEQVRKNSSSAPQTPAERLLYVSVFPLANVGQIEQVFVTLPDGVMPQGVPGAMEQLDFERRALSTYRPSGELKKALSSRAEVHAKVTERVSPLVANLSAFRPPDGVMGSLFAKDKEDRPRAVELAQSRGIERLIQYGTTSPGIRLTLPPDALANLFGDLDGWDSTDPTAISGGSMCDRLGDYLPSPILERFRATTFVAEREDRDDEEDEEPPDWAVEDFVFNELEALRPAEDEEDADLGALARVKRAVDALANDGPSDVLAYHDIHTLQIAFEDVWVEAFDSSFRSEVEELFGEWVRLHEDYGQAAPLPGDLSDVDRLNDFLDSVGSETEPWRVPLPPARIVRFWPELTPTQWNALSVEQQHAILDLAGDIGPSGPTTSQREMGERIIANPRGRLGRLYQLAGGLRERQREPYAFHYFAPNSINFGLVSTYRQEWTPTTYQVGELVATLPLAPGEQRTIKSTTVRRESSSRSEQASAAVLDRTESSSTRRAQSDVMEKAQSAFGLQQQLSGSANIGVVQFGGSTTFNTDQRSESAQRKQALREATRSAVAEYRRNHTVELESGTDSEFSLENTNVIGNPNDEITVTYLFFELERRFRLRERLHRLTPVVLVAQEVPRPEEIDEDWLISYEWILRPALLDARFHKAFDLLRDGASAREASLAIKREQWRAQKNALDGIKENLEDKLTARDVMQELIASSKERGGLAESREPSDVELAARAFFSGGASLLMGTGDEESSREEAIREAAELRLEYLNQTVNDLRDQYQRATTALERAGAAYTTAMEEHFRNMTLIDQLRVHVKDNVLHYMHAIWAHEIRDQRFFRLYHLDAPVFEGDSPCTIRRAEPWEKDAPDVIRGAGGELYIIECAPPRPTTSTVPLHRIAELDRPLGFRGNYIVFPLKTCTPITDFMAQAYIDAAYGLRDPDPFGDISLEEIDAFLDENGASLSEGERNLVSRMIRHRFQHPLRESEEVVLPTGQLFIEALRGDHPVLEEFKLMHRALDVEQVDSDVRASRLDTIRMAARLLESDYDDPDVDRYVVVRSDDVELETDPTE